MLSMKALIYMDAKHCGIRCNPMYSGSIPPASTSLSDQGLSVLINPDFLFQFRIKQFSQTSLLSMRLSPDNHVSMICKPLCCSSN